MKHVSGVGHELLFWDVGLLAVAVQVLQNGMFSNREQAVMFV